MCFESSQIVLAYGSGNSENFQNITCAHTSSKCTVNETDFKENSPGLRELSARSPISFDDDVHDNNDHIREHGSDDDNGNIYETSLHI